MKSFWYNLFYYIGKPILKFLFSLLFRYEVHGKGNIPSNCGVIIASNHLSYLDPPLLGAALPRKPIFIAKAPLFKIPILGRFIALFSLPVDRINPKPSTFKSAARALKKGYLVVIFPEGGRSATGQFLQAQKGIGLLSAITKAPIVPTLIEGTEKALPVGARFVKPAKLKVTFGKPIYPSSDKDKNEIEEEITSTIMERIKQLKEL